MKHDSFSICMWTGQNVILMQFNINGIELSSFTSIIEGEDILVKNHIKNKTTRKLDTTMPKTMTRQATRAPNDPDNVEIWTRFFFVQPFFVTSLITKCPTFAKKIKVY